MSARLSPPAKPSTPTAISLPGQQVNLDEILSSVRAGNCCRVLGPRHRAKSQLMRQAAATLRAAGTHFTAYQSLRDVPSISEQNFFAGLYADVLLVSEPDFFASLYVEIERNLLPDYTPQRQNSPTSALEFQDHLIKLIRRSDRNLALFIDDLEMAPPNLVAALLGALRAVFTIMIDQPGARFQAVVCGSLSFRQVALDNASHFESISDLVFVDDLDEQERLALAKSLLQQSGVASFDATPIALEALLEQTGGDRFLIESICRICLDEMKRASKPLITPARVAEAVELFLNRPPEAVAVEIFKQIESDPSLLSCTLRILEQGEVSKAQLPIATHETPTALDICGVFVKENGRYRIKCPLWKHLLQQRLAANHVGGLYAMAGYWSEAIKYLGEAISLGQIGVKSELFTTIISAIHASEDAPQAFGYLAQGLQATYPTSDLRLYYRSNGVLELCYPAAADEQQGRISLNSLHRPEVAAIHGPEYSIASISQETRLLIPLRFGNVASRSIGLVSLGELISTYSPYQQRDEVLQLIGFLGQAAQAIESRSQYAELLKTAKQRASKLNALNTILTRMLRHRERPEEVIWRLVLAGITSSWGLEFNRAALFMLDEGGQVLRGCFAVGHLARADAEADWESFPYKNLDELVSALLADQGKETPLHRKVKELAIPLDVTNLLVESYRACIPILSLRQRPQRSLPPALVEILGPVPEFALVPFNAGDQTLGVFYVDNKFTGRPISDEHFELLQTFVNQAGLVLKNARALLSEKKRTNLLTELLKVEETVNDQITQSVEGLLEEIVRSAGHLFGAGCVVLYPLRSGLEKGLYLYDLEYIAAWGTRQPIEPSDRPSPETGMTAWLIREGLVYRPEVKAAAPAPDGRQLADTPFIYRESIEAFVGVRLGSAEEPVGILYVNWRTPHSLTAEELTIVEVFANFVAVAIPSARRYQQTKTSLARRTQELEGLSRVFYASLEFRSEEEIEKAIGQALHTAQQYTGAPYLRLVRNEPRGSWRIFQLTPANELISQSAESIPAGIVREAFISRQPQLVVDAGPRPADAFPGRYHDDSRSGLAVPVKIAGHCLAVLLVESHERYDLTVEHREFLEYLAGGLALTLDQAERTQALRQLLDIFSSLQLMQKDGLQRVLASVVEQAMDAMRTVDAITLYYVEEETGQLELGHMAGVQHEVAIKPNPPYTRTIINYVWQLDTPIFAQDVAENSLLNGPFVRREGIKSAAAFPLKADGERVGCIFFNYRFHHLFDKGEKSLLSLFAQLAALAIHQATLYDQVERRKQRLETVARITPVISASLSPDDVLRAVLNEVKQAVPQAHNACMVQRDEEEQELVIMPVSLEFYRADHPPSQGSYRVGTADCRGIAGRVIGTGEAANVPDTGKDPDYIASIAATRSELCVPIIIEQETQAALVLESHHLNAFTADDQRLIEMLADHVAIAIRNARQYAELEAAKEELQRTRDRELREHMATLAIGLIHDINSAVASIPDLVSEIEEKIKANVDVTAPLSDLHKGARETGRISTGLREWVITKEFKPRLFSLEELIQKVIKKAQRRRQAHIQIHYGGEGQAPDIIADALWIESLLQNLISNAYEAILPEQEGLVEIEVVSDPTSVQIRVKDNGQGIVPENMHRIFEPGYTTKDDDSPLHGFGLSHCLLLVHEHQGDLQVKSSPDAGTIFTVLLPRMPHSLPDNQQ